MPKIYPPEEKQKKIDEICEYINKGLSNREALNKASVYSSTFYKWISEERHFSEQYARAMEARADLIFEDILNIADDNGKDTRFTEEGKEVTDHDVINRSRLRVDARKWYLSKMLPKKYGDKLDLTTDGESMNLSNEERQKRLEVLQAKLAKLKK